MSNSLKRLLAAATVAVVLCVPSVANAFVPVQSAGLSASQRTPSVRPSVVSLSPGFRWADAGIGAAAVLVLVGLGSGAALMIRGRVHPPFAR